MNKFLSILLIIISCFIFTGCWSYREINSLYIIAGIGIDKVPNSEQFNITAELVNIKETEADRKIRRSSLLVRNRRQLHF